MMYLSHKELEDTDFLLAYLKAPRLVKYFFFDSPFSSPHSPPSLQDTPHQKTGFAGVISSPSGPA
jgi:hypothetical protein